MNSENATVISRRTTAFFRRRFTPSRRGAQEARLVAVGQLREWGWSVEDDGVLDAASVVAELAANAVTHGVVRGRDFQLTLALAPGRDGTPVLRVEVADCRGERLPVLTPEADADDEHGRGLLLVATLAQSWGVTPRDPFGKTVWAELPLSP